MTESVSFKAYLKRDGVEVEVRRFGVDGGAATNFMYLRNKIQVMFPSINNDQFSVFWQDTDKDYVAIGSDEELMVALTSGISQPFKLFVNVTSQQPEQGVPGQPQAHHGVVCDSCEQPVVGFRYKCVTCPDFDLCAGCEASNNHSEHFMLRMPVPFGATNSCHPKFFRKFFGRQHKFHKFGRSYPQAAAFSGANTTGRCPYSRRDGSAPAPTDMFDFSALLEFINSMTGTSAREGPTNEPAASTQTSSSTQASPGQSASAQEARPPHTAGAQGARPPQPTSADYLNSVGQALTAFLNPLGVDMSFEVRTPTSRPEETPAPPQQSAPTTEAPAPSNTSAPIAVQQNIPSPASSTHEPSPYVQSQPTPVRETTPPPARRNSDDWTLLNRESPSRGEVAMDVDESRAAKPSVEAPKEPSASAAPSAPQGEASAAGSERQRIQEAVNNIRSMGFNYETTLLREMLRQENGDIASVLETILNITGKK